MRKISCILAIIMAVTFLCSKNLQAQDKEYKYTVKINPLAAAGGPFWVVIIPVTGEYKVQFEIATTQKQSLQIGASYLGPSIAVNLDELSSDKDSAVSGINTSGFRFTGAYKFFLSRDVSAPEGFYVGPYVSYASAQIKSKDNAEDKISATKLNINGIFGYQMITPGGFTLDIFTGIGFRSKKWDLNNEEESSFDIDEFTDKNGIGLALGLSFGYAF